VDDFLADAGRNARFEARKTSSAVSRALGGIRPAVLSVL
jgi:hypothetical protein